MARKCFLTHTGDIYSKGPYYPAHEAADNLTDEVSVGHRNITDAITNVDNLTIAKDNGCGTFADTYEKEGKLVSEAATMASYVGGKPDKGLHKALGGSYGAGASRANVSLDHIKAEACCGGKSHA